MKSAFELVRAKFDLPYFVFDLRDDFAEIRVGHAVVAPAKGGLRVRLVRDDIADLASLRDDLAPLPEIALQRSPSGRLIWHGRVRTKFGTRTVDRGQRHRFLIESDWYQPVLTQPVDGATGDEFEDPKQVEPKLTGTIALRPNHAYPSFVIGGQRKSADGTERVPTLLRGTLPESFYGCRVQIRAGQDELTAAEITASSILTRIHTPPPGFEYLTGRTRDFVFPLEIDRLEDQKTLTILQTKTPGQGFERIGMVVVEPGTETTIQFDQGVE